MMKISLGYPDKRSEKIILRKFKENNPLEDIKSVLEIKDIIKIQEKIKKVHVDESIDDYIVDIVSKTREHEDISLGVSPRGSLSLFKASQANAYIKGRNYVLPDDVKELIVAVLSHRIILKPESKIQGSNKNNILNDILRSIKVPVVRSND